MGFFWQCDAYNVLSEAHLPAARSVLEAFRDLVKPVLTPESKESPDALLAPQYAYGFLHGPLWLEGFESRTTPSADWLYSMCLWNWVWYRDWEVANLKIDEKELPLPISLQFGQLVWLVEGLDLRNVKTFSDYDIALQHLLPEKNTRFVCLGVFNALREDSWVLLTPWPTSLDAAPMDSDACSKLARQKVAIVHSMYISEDDPTGTSVGAFVDAHIQSSLRSLIKSVLPVHSKTPPVATGCTNWAQVVRKVLALNDDSAPEASQHYRRVVYLEKDLWSSKHEQSLTDFLNWVGVRVCCLWIFLYSMVD